MPTRRQLLKGALTTSLVLTSGVAVWQLSLKDQQLLVEADNYNYQYLTEDHRLLLFAIIPVFLESSQTSQNDDMYRLQLIAKLDQAIDFISESSWDELEQLLNLLANQLGRSLVAGVWQSWNQASSKTISEFLRDWRHSFSELIRSGYFGLHQLILGAHYAQPESWASIGYEGPPNLNLDDAFYQQFDL